jgi:hypothetical protein
MHERQGPREQLVSRFALDGTEELHAIAVDLGRNQLTKIRLVLRDCGDL